MQEHLSALVRTDCTIGAGASSKRASKPASEAERCPKCGESDIDMAEWLSGWQERAATIALRFPVVCNSCGHRFALSVLSGNLKVVVHKSLATRAAIALLALLAAVFWLGLKVATL